MTWPLSKAESENIIKPAQAIKLEDEEKKVFKDGIIFDEFSDDPSVFALTPKIKIDKKKLTERCVFAKYLFNPMNRSFRPVVRITALVLKAVRLFKIGRIKSLIKRGEASNEDLEKLQPAPVQFSLPPIHSLLGGGGFFGQTALNQP